MVLAAGSDGVLSATEWEIIASIAAVMDCPLPSPVKQPNPGKLTRSLPQRRICASFK
tara:strand:- start:5370 stop:5540 length:171 start_codon:yes stop_codon:yes gene_type:complete